MLKCIVGESKCVKCIFFFLFYSFYIFCHPSIITHVIIVWRFMHMQSDFYMREFSIESKLKTSIDKYLFPEIHGKHRIDFDQSKVTTFIFFIQLGPNGVHFWIKQESTRRTFRHGTWRTAHTEAKPKPGRERAAGTCKSPQWCRRSTRRPPPPPTLFIFRKTRLQWTSNLNEMWCNNFA